MKYIFLNLKNFFIHEKLIFFIMLMCIISSSFIICFSYGLYHNYEKKKEEAQIELNELNPEIVHGATLTKADFKNYIEKLGDDTLNKMTAIYVDGKIPELSDLYREGKAGPLILRFVLHNDEYGICEVTKQAYETQGILTSGRYIMNNEEAEGSRVAIAYGKKEGEWSEACEKLKNKHGGITMFGQDYKVIGTYFSYGQTPVVPFLTVPDDFVIDNVGFTFNRNVTRSIYEDLTETAEQMLPEVFMFPKLLLPDSDSVKVYNNMIAIAVMISFVSIVNFSMLYHFIIKKRARNLAVMRICGCSRIKAVFMYLGEALMITLPSYAIGMFVNIMMVKSVFKHMFEFMEEAYSVKVYAVLSAVYFCLFLMILFSMISKSVNKNIVEEWRG